MSRNLAAEKSDRQSVKRHLRNRMVTSKAKTLVKDFTDLVAKKKKEEAQKAYVDLSSFLDKAVNKGVIEKNAAARKKSRMSKLLSTLSA